MQNTPCLLGFWIRLWFTIASLISCLILNIRLAIFKPLSANPTKWSNTLTQFVGRLPTNCLSVFDYFVGLGLKGLKRILIAKLIFFRFHSFDLYVKIDFFSVNSTLVLKSCFYLILLRFHLLWFLIENWPYTIGNLIASDRKPTVKLSDRIPFL